MRTLRARSGEPQLAFERVCLTLFNPCPALAFSASNGPKPIAEKNHGRRQTNSLAIDDYHTACILEFLRRGSWDIGSCYGVRRWGRFIGASWRGSRAVTGARPCAGAQPGTTAAGTTAASKSGASTRATTATWRHRHLSDDV